MKSSSIVFLAAFIALSASWGGFVLTPNCNSAAKIRRRPFRRATIIP